eukprot:10370491-Alexandrium_andersonii.AAC.1
MCYCVQLCVFECIKVPTPQWSSIAPSCSPSTGASRGSATRRAACWRCGRPTRPARGSRRIRRAAPGAHLMLVRLCAGFKRLGC